LSVVFDPTSATSAVMALPPSAIRRQLPKWGASRGPFGGLHGRPGRRYQRLGLLEFRVATSLENGRRSPRKLLRKVVARLLGRTA
jgi:hypothetical protein